MAISLARGERATLAKVDAFADGVAVKTVGRECFRLCRELVDGIVLVDNRSAKTSLQQRRDCDLLTVYGKFGPSSDAGTAAACVEHPFDR